jgi:phytoene desaturase
MGRTDRGGFRIDTGPTVLTMPVLIDEALHAVGTSLAEHVTLHRLDPAYQARFADAARFACTRTGTPWSTRCASR